MLTNELVNALRGTVCQCGAPKASMHSFCRRCFCSLPGALRNRLYNRIGRGYEEAYADALTILQGKDTNAERDRE